MVGPPVRHERYRSICLVHFFGSTDMFSKKKSVSFNPGTGTHHIMQSSCLDPWHKDRDILEPTCCLGPTHRTCDCSEKSLCEAFVVRGFLTKISGAVCFTPETKRLVNIRIQAPRVQR
jgi:hypothetical protein